MKNIVSIENQFRDRECVIFGCGPSLNTLSGNLIAEICHDRIVFAIKQAFHCVPYCHYHFLNDNNLENYKYDREETNVVVECPSNNIVRHLQCIADYFFIVEQNWDINKAISRTLEFDKWTIRNSPLYRPFGPGIMFETVLFFAYHLGFRQIYTFGWDGGPVGSITRQHYYGSRQVINPAAHLLPEESEFEINCSEHFYKWLYEHGTSLSIASENSFMSSVIPRVTFDVV